ncbi:homeobox protein 13-like [Trifolium pratense]|uniref:homeobox protein 13-like n=1 Tax=Trifolium pratense TaxID=57577 RepID=UPI001E697D3B|nr:homeobox protein 13-like [Trifolium pratense]
MKMKCFSLPCFSSSKRQNHFSQPISISTPQPTLHNTNLHESIHWISKSKIQNQDQSQCINNNNNNNTHHDDLETKEEKTTTPQDNHEQVQEEKECSESLFSVSIGCRKPVSADENDDEIEVNSTPMKLHSAKDVSGSKPESNEAKEEERSMNEPLLNKYRYQDCSDDDDGYDDINLNEEGSSESSLFSISTDYKKKPISVSSIQKELVDNEVTSIMVEPQEEQEESERNNILENDENVCSSVLNPIENVSQRKVKATLLHSVKEDKENINWNQQEPSLNLKLSLSSNKKMNIETEKGKEIGVDTSLSSWLVESESKYNTPKRCDVEDRPILGALTVEEIRKYSSNISRTSSRTHSPEEAPIIGSVGSYWNHSEQRKSSKSSNKYGKEGKQEWSSTTVKTRLEPAFEAASQCCSKLT